MALAAGITQVAIAQSEPVQPASAAARAKQTLGLIFYPAGGPTPEHQARDEQACHAWVQQRIDPMASGPTANGVERS